jgi:hypothetical protein
MHLLRSFILATIFSVSLVESLQNIYIGTINKVYQNPEQESYYVWFIDSPVCTSGTQLGEVYGGPNPYGLCNISVTILGHTGITFTGCTKATSTTIAGWPTGVSDGGNRALTCSFISLTNKPPTQPVVQTCPVQEPSNGDYSIVSIVLWCK